MNDLKAKNYDMQTLMNLMGAQMQNVNTLTSQVGAIYEDVQTIKSSMKNTESRLYYLERQVQVSYQQRLSIRKAINRRVYEILGIPAKRDERSEDDLITTQKYSQIFHQRCYTEVARMGHLASPYGLTTTENFDAAIKDIEAWTPICGIANLKHEADKNAAARLEARVMGYR